MALCALIHKHRPKLIPWETLKPENAKENLALAMEAANIYFDLEKYLTPDDIPKLGMSIIHIISHYHIA